MFSIDYCVLFCFVQYDESLAAHYGGMESMYDPHAAHRSLPSHSHHSVSVSPAATAAAAAAAAAMHHSAAAAAAAAAQSHSPYHSIGNHVSQVGANHMAAAAAAAANVPDVHKRDKDAIYGSVFFLIYLVAFAFCHF